MTVRTIKRRITATGRIRAAVVERANGFCECGCGAPVSEEFGEMDHAFGRARVPQSVENCWFLAPRCHRQKTDNFPSAMWWVEDFRRHCQRHGYGEQEHRCEVRLEVIEAKGFA